MPINRAAIKADARAAMAQSKTSPYITALVYVLVTYVLGYLSMRILRLDVLYAAVLNSYALSYEEYDQIMQLNSIFSSAGLLNLLIQLMSFMLGIGFIIFALHTARREPNSIGNLFDGFSNLLRLIGLQIMCGIFTYLWSLLFIIPGIVASYRYRMAVYLLLDDPKRGLMDCIRESKRMMTGRKGELFVLDLSFIGWQLLTAIPFVSIYVMPYASVTYANYYIALKQAQSGVELPPPEPPKADDTPPWEFKD